VLAVRTLLNHMTIEISLEKIPVDGGSAVQVRCQDRPAPESLSPDGATLYYYNGVENAFGGVEVWKARPENGPSELLVRLPGSRLPFDGFVWQQTLSPDGNWLAAPLVDRGTTNLWVMPVHGGLMRQRTLNASQFWQRSQFRGTAIGPIGPERLLYSLILCPT
jgi:hypothetical protein